MVQELPLAAARENAARTRPALDVDDDGGLRDRVLAAVVREMGQDAPPAGSKSRDALAHRLFHAVCAHRLARVELLSGRLRSALQEAYVLSEDDAGAFGREWRRDIALNGKRGLADQTDAQLLERVFLNVSHHYLVSSNGT